MYVQHWIVCAAIKHKQTREVNMMRGSEEGDNGGGPPPALRRGGVWEWYQGCEESYLNQKGWRETAVAKGGVWERHQGCEESDL